MALFVFVTENCKDDANTHGLLDEVERFKERVESTQSTSLFDHFPPPYLVKKRLGGRQGRLIADQRTVGDHAVVVFLAILIRGDRAYEDQFVKDPVGYGQRHFKDLVSEEQLSRFIAERTRTTPPPDKPEPSGPEYEMLYNAFAHHNGSVGADELVCESKEWVEQVTQDRISNQLVRFCRPCLDALSEGPGLHFLPVTDKQGWGIWALRSEGRLFLITPATEETAVQAKAMADAYSEKLKNKDATAVLQASRRAYPAIILADDELWIELEKEPLANMALSPEESEVLESARHSDGAFPLFINGRAGSGKSTILQYLFADLLFHYLCKPEEARVIAPPVYLTVNGELLRVARGFVEKLLRSEATFSQLAEKNLVENNRDLMDEAFREFQPHLLSLVEPNERTIRFARGDRVDYTRFRRMWMDRFGQDKKALRDFGPDLSWHVIRTYVKGMSSETFLDPDEYQQLPENQLTVTKEAFERVFDRVWMKWYQPMMEKEHLWDDQDLTRYILDKDLAKPTYPAVFCDEAQDFTRLELELLLRMNLFSDRSLQPAELSRVPFAFAGDQFQTLNPTGFRWDAIKAHFVEKFIFALDPARRSGRTDLNYRELKFNYRSTSKITRFCNEIQALRAALFQTSELRPQEPWAAERDSFPVEWFRSNDGVFWKKYRENEGFIVILPCNEGEEADYVEQDPILRQHIKFEDGIPINVLSAARSKGREYPAVIVYGFGAAAEHSITRYLEGADEDVLSDPDKSLPLQYFINRLYVAASRPKRRLIIVDTEVGFGKLWRFAQDEQVEHKMLNRIKSSKIWQPLVEGMTIGNPEDLTRESVGDPLENARAFEADGLARQDAFLLKQAAQAYRSGGDIAKAKECRALSLELEGQWLDAGEAFFEAGFAVPEGVRNLWRAGQAGWRRLRDKVSEFPNIRQETEFRWASALASQPKLQECKELLAILVRRIAEDPAFADACVADGSWRNALSDMLQPLIEKHNSEPNKGDWGEIATSLGKIRVRGLRIPPKPCAQVFFLADRFSEAVKLWEEAGTTTSIDYQKAKAAIEPYPQRILSLSRLKLTDEIVKAYLENSQTDLSPDQANAVTDALYASRRLDAALGLAWRSALPTAAVRICARAIRDGDKPLAKQSLHMAFNLLVQAQQWEPLINFASSLEFIPEKNWSEKPIKEFVEAEADALQFTLVRSIARSEGLPNAQTHIQRQISDFLRRFLRVKDSSWRGRIRLEEAGAAFERAGRFTDAISFYEAVIKERFSDEEKEFARRRRLACKRRQMDYERGLSAKVRADEIQKEMDKVMRSLGIEDMEEIENFPTLSQLTPHEFILQDLTANLNQEPVSPLPESQEKPLPQSLLAEQVNLTIGPFKIEASRKNRRCNITHGETMETAYIKIGDKTCGGEVTFKRINDHSFDCSTWNLLVRFSEASQGALEVTFKNWGVTISVQE
jgi:tetratricopeptide (TPR) repeat protein